MIKQLSRFLTLVAVTTSVVTFQTDPAIAQDACSCVQWYLYYDGESHVYQTFDYECASSCQCSQYAAYSGLHGDASASVATQYFCTNPALPCSSCNPRDGVPRSEVPRHTVIDGRRAETPKTVESPCDIHPPKFRPCRGEWFVLHVNYEDQDDFWAKVFLLRPDGDGWNPVHGAVMALGFKIEAPNADWKEENLDRLMSVHPAMLQDVVPGENSRELKHQFKKARIGMLEALIRIPNLEDSIEPTPVDPGKKSEQQE